jgi:GTPase-associated system helical domain
MGGEMHKEFADWVHDLLHTTKGKHLTTLRAWSDACEKLVSQITAAQIYDLVSLSFGTNSNQAYFSKSLRDSFKAEDPGFRIKDDFALRVLSGVVLLSFFSKEVTDEKQFKLRWFAATATVAASLGLTRNDCQPPSLLETAVEMMNRESARRREITRVSFSADLQELKRAQRKLRYSAKGDDALTTEQAKLLNTIVAPAIELLPSLPVILHNQDILQEETEMAWWVQAGQSRSLGQPLDEIPPAALPIVIGFELAERTRVFPSGVAAKHLISHVLKNNGQRNHEVSFDEVVASLTETWSLTVMERMPPNSPRVTPLLYLLEASVRRGANWTHDYFAKTGIEPKTQLPAATLGYAFYQECLTTRQRREA